jgi:hypothetical protein
MALFESTYVINPGGFQDRCLKPLGHPSGMVNLARVCRFERRAADAARRLTGACACGAFPRERRARETAPPPCCRRSAISLQANPSERPQASPLFITGPDEAPVGAFDEKGGEGGSGPVRTTAGRTPAASSPCGIWVGRHCGRTGLSKLWPRVHERQMFVLSPPSAIDRASP